jgi:uncharacterized protein (TIGR00251 family)
MNARGSAAMQIRLKVVPKASRDGVAGWVGDRLKVRVRAAPERGRANAAVVELLAERLGLPRGAVRILAGHAAPEKLVEIDAPEPEVRAKLPPR